MIAIPLFAETIINEVHVYISKENNHRYEEAKKALEPLRNAPKIELYRPPPRPELASFNKSLNRVLLASVSKKRRYDFSNHPLNKALDVEDPGLVDGIKARMEAYGTPLHHAMNQYLDSHLCSDDDTMRFLADDTSGRILGKVDFFFNQERAQSSASYCKILQATSECSCKPGVDCWCKRKQESVCLIFNRLVEIEKSIARLLTSDDTRLLMKGLLVHRSYSLWRRTIDARAKFVRRGNCPMIILPVLKLGKRPISSIPTNFSWMAEWLGVDVPIQDHDRPSLDQLFDISNSKLDDEFVFNFIKAYARYGDLRERCSFDAFMQLFNQLCEEHVSRPSGSSSLVSDLSLPFPSVCDEITTLEEYRVMDALMQGAFDLFCFLPDQQPFSAEELNEILAENLKDFDLWRTSIEEIQKFTLEKKREAFLKERSESMLLGRIDTIWKICRRLSDITDDECKVVRNNFEEIPMFSAIRCTKTDCHFGIVDLTSGSAACHVCSTPHCKECWYPSDEGHECDPDSREFVNDCILRQNRFTQCTRCRSILERESGCDSFFCTICKRRFDFATGENSTRTDNPEYEQYVKNSNSRYSLPNYFLSSPTSDDNLLNNLEIVVGKIAESPMQSHINTMVLDVLRGSLMFFDPQRGHTESVASLQCAVGFAYASFFLPDDSLCRKNVIDLFKTHHVWYRFYAKWKHLSEKSLEFFGFENYETKTISELNDMLAEFYYLESLDKVGYLCEGRYTPFDKVLTRNLNLTFGRELDDGIAW